MKEKVGLRAIRLQAWPEGQSLSYKPTDFLFHINVLWEERKEMKLNLKMIPSVSS